MANNERLVTVIVPIYNIECFAKKCIDSVLNQTYKNLEIVLVDDGSTDGSPAICDEYAKKDQRIVVIHKPNGGLSDARNAGLDIATGDYITFIDGDDWYDENAIENMVMGLSKQFVGISYMGINSVDPSLDIKQSDKQICSIDDSKTFLSKICNTKVGTSVCSKMFKKEMMGNRRFIKGRLNEDFYFVSCILLQNETLINTLDYNGYYYLAREGSITHSVNRKSILDAIDNCNDLYDMAISLNKTESLKDIIRMALHQSYVAIVINPEYKKHKNSEFYIKATTTIKRYKKYIKKAYLPRKEKIVCKLASIFPYLTACIFNFMYRTKNMINKK